MKNLYKSLAAFQQECPVIHKGTKGYGYSYAALPEILEVINPLMKNYGLGFTQQLTGDSLTTTIFHIESGECISSCANIPQGVQLKGMNDFQVLGSAVTYMRRYALSAALGIVTDKDTDAGGEQEKTPTQKPNTTATAKREKILPGTDLWEKSVVYLIGGGNLESLKKKYDILPDDETELLKEVTDRA